jgi:hypothetical protein
MTLKPPSSYRTELKNRILESRSGTRITSPFDKNIIAIYPYININKQYYTVHT